jgi:uncharacterized protein (TIGR03437 family)
MLYAKVVRTSPLLAILTGLVSVASSQVFTTIDVPGASSTTASGINNSGQIVVNAPNGYLDSGGTFSPIYVSGSTYTYAYGISAGGQIVGAYRGVPGTSQYGFLDSSGVFTNLGFPCCGVDDLSAQGISSNGLYIVGWYITGPSSGPNPYHAFIYSSGGFDGFNAPPCNGVSDRTNALGVNDSGQVVGFCYNGSYVGFLFSGGVYSSILFPGASGTVPVGINNNGAITGYYSNASGTHGFLYSAGNYTSIDVPGATQTMAAGINDNGEIVGSYTDASGNTHGFMYGGITGYVNLRWVVMGVTYAPPGKSANTFVQYVNSNSVGTTQSASSSFTSTTTNSVSVTHNTGIPAVTSGQITDTNSMTSTQMSKTSSTVTTSFQVQQGEKTFGTGDYFNPVNHDYDTIWIWLNPVAIFTVYKSGAVVWNGYGFDMGDQPEMDIVGIQLGYLNGDFGPMPPPFQTAVGRAWAAGQIFATGQGPALTQAELTQIASFDPFSASTYGPQFIGPDPPSPETADHRFTLSSCSSSASFSYNQAAPSGSAAVYTCALTYATSSTLAQELTTTYSQTFSVDKSTSTNFLQILQTAIEVYGAAAAVDTGRLLGGGGSSSSSSATLTWTTDFQQSITTGSTSTASLSVQGPPCGNTNPGVGPCVPVYDSANNQPTQFDVYQDNLYGTFVFAPVHFYPSGIGGTPLTVASLSPNSAPANGPAFSMTVSGAGFLSGSTVQWNGVALSTTYVSSSQLTASVPASLIALTGSASITVLNPGDITSNSLPFLISTTKLTILTASPLPAGSVGVSYSEALTATGGVTPYKGWAVTSGSVPPGISLSQGVLAGTGLLSGTPTSAGTFTFALQVTDSSNAIATATFTLTVATPTTVPLSGIVNAASYVGGKVAPGEIITIFGSFPGPAALLSLQLDSRGYVATNLGGMEVLFDGVQAPMIYAMAGQASCIVPYEVSGRSSTTVQLSYPGQLSNSVTVPVAAVAPGVFTMNSSGSGPGAIINQNGTVNSAANPAAPGSTVMVYATGEGPTNPPGIDGKPDAAPLPQPVTQPVTATVGGTAATVTYAGGVSGLVAGVLQVNVQIPQGIPSGSAVPIALSIGGTTTQSNVTVAIH